MQSRKQEKAFKDSFSEYGVYPLPQSQEKWWDDKKAQKRNCPEKEKGRIYWLKQFVHLLKVLFFRKALGVSKEKLKFQWRKSGF